MSQASPRSCCQRTITSVSLLFSAKTSPQLSSHLQATGACFLPISTWSDPSRATQCPYPFGGYLHPGASAQLTCMLTWSMMNIRDRICPKTKSKAQFSGVCVPGAPGRANGRAPLSEFWPRVCLYHGSCHAREHVRKIKPLEVWVLEEGWEGGDGSGVVCVAIPISLPICRRSGIAFLEEFLASRNQQSQNSANQQLLSSHKDL